MPAVVIGARVEADIKILDAALLPRSRPGVNIFGHWVVTPVSN
jgi:hypothetical protein